MGSGDGAVSSLDRQHRGFPDSQLLQTIRAETSTNLLCFVQNSLCHMYVGHSICIDARVRLQIERLSVQIGWGSDMMRFGTTLYLLLGYAVVFRMMLRLIQGAPKVT
ncbi:hypothetical protein N658DRAFT_491541 [Parathielavia hyrcaniae]|uniref:Uncharacterized protein n=1 Tax=Parathielavia hyrcaniae TaxID=113614 RepID=A0AAN6T6T4_9PEZI|nr:hypothetical protein N658DRAFT_491541 [Parathielavia hyrcaniae]